MSIDKSHIGKIVEGYKILKSLGHGQYATVYHAERLVDSKYCALKIVKVYSMTEEDREKCLGEVKLLQSLDHPGILKHLDSFIKDKQLYIAIELAEKGDLKKQLKKYEQENERIEEIKIINYLKTLSSALMHMHSKRIMHRDLKPANILCFYDGVKVGDFGLGRLMSDNTLMVKSKVGTPLYMAPEVIFNTGYNFKSDIWSLGCVLYELITLKSPFRSNEKMTLPELFDKINKANYNKLDESSCCKLLVYLVDKMLQPEPDNRISLQEIVKLCEEYLESNKDNSPKIDKYTIAEDIQEKLNLLNVDINFCKIANCKIDKFSFTNQKKNVNQFKLYYELVSWIIYLIKNKIPYFKSNQFNYSLILYNSTGKNLDEYNKKMLNNLQEEFKLLKIEVIDLNKLTLGYGDNCIIILTQLLDRYLIDQNYTFVRPNFSNLKESNNLLYSNLNNFNFENIINKFIVSNIPKVNSNYSKPNNKKCVANEISKVSNSNSEESTNNTNCSKFIKFSDKINKNNHFSYNESNWFKELIAVNDKLENAEKIIYNSNESYLNYRKSNIIYSTTQNNELDNLKTNINNYILSQEETIKDINKKENVFLFKDKSILSKFNRTRPKIMLNKDDIKSIEDRISDKVVKLEKIDKITKYKKDNGYNKCNINNNKSTLEKNIMSLKIKENLLNITLNNALLNNKKHNTYYTDESNNYFDEIY